MRLYPCPGGTWEGTEADWKKAMKAQGLDPKLFEDTKTREVPTAKKDLLEFLNFFAVDVFRTTEATVPVVDVGALRALHNPSADDSAPPPVAVHFDLDAAFEAAPIGQQLRLAVVAIDTANAEIAGRS